MADFFSGSLDPSLPHVVLLSVAIAGSFAVAVGIVLENPKFSLANILVVGGVVVEAICTLVLFGFDEGISNAQQSKIITLQGRTWTKAQFDAIQKIKGKVKAVGISTEKGCLECRMFSENIELALHAAGVQLYEDPSLDWVSGTGIHVSLPAELGSLDEQAKGPLIVALREADLNPAYSLHVPTEWSAVRTDIPVIFVGEKFPSPSSFPYSPSGQSQWTVGPLKNPAYTPPDLSGTPSKMHLQLGGPKQ